MGQFERLIFYVLLFELSHNLLRMMFEILWIPYKKKTMQKNYLLKVIILFNLNQVLKLKGIWLVRLFCK